MRNLQFTVVAFLVITLNTTQLYAASSVQNPQESAAKGQIHEYNAKDDFVTGIYEPMVNKYASKNELLSSLDNLIKDEKNVPNLTEAFRQIEQSTLLTREEKIKWLKDNQAKLPAPFMMLLATLVAPDNIQEAFAWNYLGDLRMRIDAKKCNDPSVSGGITIIKQKLLPQLVPYIPGKNDEEKGDNFTKLAYGAYNDTMALYKSNPYDIAYPYWIANHGMDHILVSQGLGKGKNDPFKPKNEWKKIEEEIITTYTEQVGKKDIKSTDDHR